MDENEHIKEILKRYFPESDELSIKGALKEIDTYINIIIEDVRDEYD